MVNKKTSQEGGKEEERNEKECKEALGSSFNGSVFSFRFLLWRGAEIHCRVLSYACESLRQPLL